MAQASAEIFKKILFKSDNESHLNPFEIPNGSSQQLPGPGAIKPFYSCN